MNTETKVEENIEGTSTEVAQPQEEAKPEIKPEVCPACKGYGRVYEVLNAPTCETCGGTGK